MNVAIRKTMLLVLAALLLAFVADPLMAQVYKIVDKDGNITYTDTPPNDGSKPIKLRPISIIEAPVYEKAPVADKGGVTAEEEEEKPLRYLRGQYRDFAISSPRPEETIQNPENAIVINWRVASALLPGMYANVFVDGAQQGKTSDRVVRVNGLDRGEHTVSAELRDSKNRLIVTAQPVVFFIRQPGLINNAFRPAAAGG